MYAYIWKYNTSNRVVVYKIKALNIKVILQKIRKNGWLGYLMLNPFIYK